ncbi:MAG: ABC transporter substrate-binding protein, partial [Deltaproteobacteria bacterium]|nr:ABC transporter substrate-binding protein [Deltaproteobacteria bacterium]
MSSWAKEKVQIGVILDPNGRFFNIQKPIYNGIKLYFTDKQDKKDKKDFEIKLIEAPDTLEGQKQASENVIKNDIRFILGHNFSSSSKMFLESLPKNYEMTYVTPSATSLELLGLNNGVFIIWPNNESQVKALIAFLTAKNLLHGKIVFLTNQSETFATEMAKYFKDFVKNNKAISIEEVSFIKDTPDLEKAVKAALSKNPDIILATSYSYELITIYQMALKLLKDQQQKPVFLAGDNVGRESIFFSKLGTEKPLMYGNFFFTEGWSASIQTKDNLKFISDFKQAYKEDPSAKAAAGYDAAKLLASAIRKSKTKSPQEVNRILGKISENLTTGRAKMSKNRTLSRPVPV